MHACLIYQIAHNRAIRPLNVLIHTYLVTLTLGPPQVRDQPSASVAYHDSTAYSPALSCHTLYYAARFLFSARGSTDCCFVSKTSKKTKQKEVCASSLRSPVLCLVCSSCSSCTRESSGQPFFTGVRCILRHRNRRCFFFFFFFWGGGRRRREIYLLGCTPRYARHSSLPPFCARTTKKSRPKPFPIHWSQNVTKASPQSFLSIKSSNHQIISEDVNESTTRLVLKT